MAETRRDEGHRADSSGIPTRGGFLGLGDTGANHFDVLRFVLAALVVLSHSYPLLHGSNRYEPLSRLTGGQLTLGGLAVDGFFVLSGFLIHRSWLRCPRPAAFLRKRALRIYPAFLASAVFGAFVVGPLGNPAVAYWPRFSLARFVTGLISFEVNLPPVFQGLPFPAFNGSLWSIRFEFIFYLGVMVLGCAGLWHRRWGAALAFAMAMTVYVIQGKFWPLGPWGLNAANPWPRLTTLFLAGAAFDASRHRIPRSSGLALVALGALCLFAGRPRWQMLALAVPVLGSYLLFYLASMPIPRLHRWGRRGDYSYGLYLHAFPLQQLIVRYVGPEHLTPIGLFALALPITGLLALASWRLVESPFLRRKQQGRASATPHGRPARAAGQVQSAT